MKDVSLWKYTLTIYENYPKSSMSSTFNNFKQTRNGVIKVTQDILQIPENWKRLCLNVEDCAKVLSTDNILELLWTCASLHIYSTFMKVWKMTTWACVVPETFHTVRFSLPWRALHYWVAQKEKSLLPRRFCRIQFRKRWSLTMARLLLGRLHYLCLVMKQIFWLRRLNDIVYR